jgi:hypothetical protein
VRMTTSDNTLLGIYLNDHLAGATAGTELAQRLGKAETDWSGGKQLQRVATEIKEDRQALVDLMNGLNVPVRHYKTWAAWAMEKAARLKPNARLTARSPLSRLEELEILRLGVDGKAAGWRTLREWAEKDDRLNKGRLDTLLERAHQQSDQLEGLRVKAAMEAFAGE